MSKKFLKIFGSGWVLLLFFCTSASAFFWNNATLVTINGQQWSIEDYQNWWQEWREPGMALPSSADDFIDWLLLADEAERMQLFEQPRYQQKVSTFLKVRSLMMLKQQEIDSNIVLSEAEIKAEYQREYAPLLKLRSLRFDHQEQCELFLAAAATGKSTTQILADPLLSLPDQGELAQLVQRPNQLPADIRRRYDEAGNARYLSAHEHNNAWFIIEIIEKTAGSDADLAQVREKIRYNLNKKKQRELTARLNTRLIEKFNVVIDHEAVQRIHLTGPDTEITDQAVITFPNMVISAQLLYENALSHYTKFGGAKRKDTSFEEIVQRILNDIVVQTVTTHEALQRHYEEKPPFQSVFFFYQRHRLIRELESILLHPKTTVSEQELLDAYQSNKPNYALAQRVTIATVDTSDARLAMQLKEQLRQGHDFQSVLRLLAPAGIENKNVAMAHLVPELQQLLNTLHTGQSEMLQIDDTFHFVRLIEAPKVEYHPLDEVRESLLSELTQQKFKDAKADLLRQLRQHSTISINPRNWRSCLEQLARIENQESRL